MILLRAFILLSMTICFLFSANSTHAQITNLNASKAEEKEDEPVFQGQEIIKLRDNLELQKRLSEITIEDPSDLRTLMFTLWQYQLLQDAKQGYISNLTDESAEDYGTNSGLRELSLSGIAYKNAKTWTVWLNGERVTPEAIPLEVIDIKVRNEYVELKWYDSINNLVYPIRLRPHERFNLDSRIFLPGVTPK